MPEPGLTEYATAILRRRRGILTNNIENHNPVSRSMKEYETFEMESGGRTLVEEVFYDENDTVMHYHGGQQLNTAYNPTMTAFEVDWKQFAGAVVINGREERMNAGPEGKIKLLKSRVKGLEYSMQNFFNADLISDGTGDNGLQMGGIKYWIPTTPTSGIVGGIDRSSSANAWARNFKFDCISDTSSGAPGGDATTAANFKRRLNYCINSTSRDQDTVKVILAGQSYFEMGQEAMDSMQRITKEGNTAKAGFTTIYWNGIEIVMCGGVNFGGQTQVQTDRAYGINTRFTKVRIHENAYMEPLPQVQSINADAKAQIVVFMGNMTCSAPKLNFVMFDS